MAALAYHSHELTSYTYLTAEELVEGLVVEMEGPVVGLRGRWRGRCACSSGVPVPQRTNQREFAAADPPDAKRTATPRHCVNHV